MVVTFVFTVGVICISASHIVYVIRSCLHLWGFYLCNGGFSSPQSELELKLVWIFQEPSLFAVAKLLETGLVNLPRVEVLWRPLTNHLLEVCQHPHIRMREWGVEAVTYLVKAALQHKYQPPLRDNQVCWCPFIVSMIHFIVNYSVFQKLLMV